MNKQITCPSCGAQFEDTLPKCPYCGTMYYPAAEKEYMDQMEDLREDVGELKQLPREEAKKHLKKRARFIWIALFLLAAAAALIGWLYVRHERNEAQETEEEYLWIRANAPELDRLYENGQYDELTERYSAWRDEGRPVWLWEHSEFTYRLSEIREAEELRREVDASPDAKELLAPLLYSEISLMDFDRKHPDLSEEEYRYLLDEAAPYLEDMKTRFRLDDEKLEEIRKTAKENYGIYSYRDCETIVQEFLKENPS